MATKIPLQAQSKKKYSAADDAMDFVRTFLIPFDDIAYILKGRKKKVVKK